MLQEILSASLEDIIIDSSVIDNFEEELAWVGVGASAGTNGSCEGKCSSKPSTTCL